MAWDKRARKKEVMSQYKSMACDIVFKSGAEDKSGETSTGEDLRKTFPINKVESQGGSTLARTTSKDLDLKICLASCHAQPTQ
ncbi:hypothetical protein ACJX0J_041826, partial [Zea mays]